MALNMHYGGWSYNGSRGGKTLVGLIPSALHSFSDVREVPRCEVEEMAHPAHQGFLVTR